MNLNAKELIDQENLILTMNFGLLMMEDMEEISALWDNKLLTLEESKMLNVIMERN